MSNIIALEFSNKTVVESERKLKNLDIVYRMYKKGIVKHNPYAYTIKRNKHSVVRVPAACFITGRFFKVGD